MENHELSLNTISFSVPILATGNTDKKISIYIYQADSNSFTKSLALPGHDNWIRSLQFATYTEGSEDATSKAFNHTLRQNDLILASGSQDKYIRLWKVSPEDSSNHSAALKAEPAASNGDGSTLTKDMLEALEESVKYVPIGGNYVSAADFILLIFS